ncbi:hypothetical protein OGAPHI_002212 [Ogataea philodendri]|uniref:Inner centromere protein ARK-binding domain-containing protein n=1 Tax=Ogataea philodendri TaxID=1378263 RepID=A0A9P8PA84_9ASCO|nr:uncharacterized protein OGAPHI_002212 [Ogataea philodendri]KAH3668458.1 hypothetical protein OGAPHI_002212 [Ogataea philodendri]
MWGVKAAARLKKQRESTAGAVDTTTIPGFSKWFAQEVHVETKLIKSSVDQLGLAMMEHNEWINEVMSELNLSSDTSDSLMVEEEKENDESVMMLLRSPAKFRREHSPVKEIRSKEIQMLREQVNIVNEEDIRPRVSPPVEEPEKVEEHIEHEQEEQPQPEISQLEDQQPNNSSESPSRVELPAPLESPKQPVVEEQEPEQPHTVKEPITILPVEKSPSPVRVISQPVVSSSPEKALSDAGSSDISFDAISKNIRKSFARKTMMHEESSPKEEFTRPIVHETVATTPTDYVPKQTEKSDAVGDEGSVLLDEGDIMLSDIDNEISFQIGKLEKIELAQIRIPLKTDAQSSKLPNINNSTTPNAGRSPIKFAELPSREPLLVKSNKKKSLRKSIHQVQKKPTKVSRGPAHALMREEAREELSPFKDYGSSNSSINKQPYNLRLPPINDASPSNTGSSEPTIKINRGLVHRSSPLRNELSKSPVKSPAKSPSKPAQTNLFSRLMAPTEASTKRIKASPMREEQRKSLVQTEVAEPMRKSQLLAPIKLEKYDEIPRLTESPSKPKSFGFSKLAKPQTERLAQTDKSLRKSKMELRLPHEQSKSKLPLTEQMLQPSMVRSQFGLGSPDAKSLIDLSKKLEKRKKSEHLLQNKKQRTDIKLRQISVNHPKLNRLPEPAGKVVSEIPIKKAQKPTILEAHELPEISSDNEDDDGLKQLASWGTNANIKQLLRRQAKTDPSSVFGHINKINCSEIFERSHYGNLNIRWNEGDLLGQREIEEYDRKMGYR